MKTKYEAKMTNGKTITRMSTNPNLKWFGFDVKARWLKGDETVEVCEARYTVYMRSKPDGLMFPRPLIITQNA